MCQKVQTIPELERLKMQKKPIHFLERWCNSIGLETVLFLVLFVPVEGPLYACLLRLILLFAMKDFLNIPTKIFMIILVLLGVILGFQLINSISGLGMY